MIPIHHEVVWDRDNTMAEEIRTCMSKLHCNRQVILMEALGRQYGHLFECRDSKEQNPHFYCDSMNRFGKLSGLFVLVVLPFSFLVCEFLC